MQFWVQTYSMKRRFLYTASEITKSTTPVVVTCTVAYKLYSITHALYWRRLLHQRVAVMGLDWIQQLHCAFVHLTCQHFSTTANSMVQSTAHVNEHAHACRQ
jgi:hypothetical protein